MKTQGVAAQVLQYKLYVGWNARHDCERKIRTVNRFA